jgi:uncharacterized protein YbjT (DUF2867 family)
MILVAGSTGMVGGEVCNLLRAAGRPVRALVRATSAPEKVERLRALGCDIAVGDLRDRASLDAACRGVEMVITTISAMPFSWSPPDNTITAVDLNGQKALMDAAKAAGVRHFTHTTFSGNLSADFPLGRAKRAAEEYLRASGMEYTILRPSFFMEVWLSPAAGFDVAGTHAAIYGSGDNPISWISYADVAQFAAASLDNPAARNTALELGGPEALTPLEVVSIFEQVGGRRFEIAYVPEEAIAVQQVAAPDEMQASFAGLMLCYAAGDLIPMEAMLRAFPISMATVHSYAERILVPYGVEVDA